MVLDNRHCGTRRLAQLGRVAILRIIAVERERHVVRGALVAQIGRIEIGARERLECAIICACIGWSAGGGGVMPAARAAAITVCVVLV